MNPQELIEKQLEAIKRSLSNLSDDELIIIGLISMVAYFIWLFILFSWFRPRLARWLGRCLNATISNSLITGSWEISRGNRWWKSIVVFVVEISVFIGGAFGPFLMGGLILFGYLD